MTKILSVKDGYDIKSESQSQHSCLKFKFPAKTINQSGSRRKSRQVFTCNRQIPAEVSAQKTCQHWKLTTKLDPCGGGKGGPISKLWATLNKVVFRRLSKLYLFSSAPSLLIAIWDDWRLVNKGPEEVWLRAKLNKIGFERVNIPSPKKPSQRQGTKLVRNIEKPQYKLLLGGAPGGTPRPVQLQPARSRIQGHKPLNYQKLILHTLSHT